ncbi:MgtC/SapB family protein [Companilactobacillus sp.]|uniref:MgtC/SapB family protein n=1 Tax=Companilactobacillus sp. TaxID=2767905 RepID=UPI0025BE5414|nr:MgtC/SapB family protein [Companilactobacillus sp.]MCH4008348.1 MgtC/SapB family protein [Companilactobacillus sp.]MCH4051473.1 MgtC/SapB family protein [Companilactobacillus sp.]MCH4076291.1 MgtC/SapB family protein [Companilactobacillus sp.]MCH4124866.1 MgtC/SapB family protein [Companilactobacillus sp.]MCH4131408.1 MgtC/SapB family protein [Companilactobacillus sp.]
MTFQLDAVTVIVRLLLATVISGVIGYDRAQKHRPAGIRTHILVCLGACIIALIQKEIGFNALEIAKQYPQYKGIVRADDARLIAQVVSGIGFLGAGTIIVEHHSIKGLTTAASLWVVACLGLAVGMGNYVIAIASFVVVYGVIAFLKRIVRVSPVRNLEIQYLDKDVFKKFIKEYFQEHDVKVNNVSYKANKVDGEYTYTNVYEVKLPRKLTYVQVVEDLSGNGNITKVNAVTPG